MRFSVDPWDPGYGTSVDAELGTSSSEVDPQVELPPRRWEPLDPPPGQRGAETVLFIDGVRRVDAQLWVDEALGAAPALCASYAAGVVCCGPDGASVLDARVRRGMFTSAIEATDVLTSAGRYRVTIVPELIGRVPGQVLSNALQRGLTELEREVADAVGERAGLIVLDGPLRQQVRADALGFVKSHRDSYLPPQLGGIVGALGPGQRTPVFRISRSENDALQRFSWYLRLPTTATAPWAGVARVECGADAGPQRAVELAGSSQLTLPRFASAEYKDSRAPQNLYPIAGLERALRRRLGEQAVLYRALRRAAASGAERRQPAEWISKIG